LCGLLTKVTRGVGINIMLKISPMRLAAGLLVVMFLLGGAAWLDTLDLTDDIQLSHPLTFGQQVVEQEEGKEYLLSLLHGALVFSLVSPVLLPSRILPCSSPRLVAPQSDRPLYQSLCTYRI